MQSYVNILRDGKALQELDEVIKDIEEMIDNSMPGLSPDSRDRVVQTMCGLALIYPDADEQFSAGKLEEICQEAVKNDEQWAKEVAEVVTNNHFRPAYQKAVKAGVDPVDFLRASLGMSQENAKKLAEYFAQEGKK